LAAKLPIQILKKAMWLFRHTVNLSNVPISPLPTAMPIPDKATYTVPHGANEVRLLTAFVSIMCMPGADTRLNKKISFPVPGCITNIPSPECDQYNGNTKKRKMINSEAGCGSAFPVRSTMLRNLFTRYFFLALFLLSYYLIVKCDLHDSIALMQ
jgi:hypothetical protein